jgi:hypothetical protein
MSRFTLLAALAPILFVAPSVSAQHADQKALEVAVRSLHQDSDARLIVSPVMVAPQIDGNVKIDEPNREVLETRLGAEIIDLEEAVTCEDLARPETCSVAGGGVIYQFFMPEPLRNGVLQLSVMLLKDGEGEQGQIKREWWNLALVRQPDVGWTVADKQLQDSENGPW